MTTIEEAAPLRTLIHAFAVSHLYTKVRPVLGGDEIKPPTKEWSAWLVPEKQHYPPWIVVDVDGQVRESRHDLCLVPLDEDMVSQVYSDLLASHAKELFRIGRDWSCRIQRSNEEEPFIEESEYIEKRVFVAPVPRLRDPSYLRGVDWPAFVESVISPAATKDPRIKLVQKAHLPNGIDISVAPHAIITTNGGTTKSTFYQQTGENFGKVSAGSFLGFAKSPTEIFPGIINGTSLSQGIDQIESQSAAEILRFMFNALERGWDYVGNGATKFKVTTSSTFALLANTYQEGAQASRSFAALLDHISNNAAIGRRFGVFLYGSDFLRVTRKIAKADEAAWKEKIEEYRAIEEYAWPRIQEIMHSKAIWGWVNSPIDGYEDNVGQILESVQDETVQELLSEHAKGGQARIRGAAVYAAFVDHLKAIALDEFDEAAFLEDAEELLRRFVANNVQSIGKLCAEYAKQVTAQRAMAFKTLPDYLQEIVSAVELWRRRKPAELTFNNLASLLYVPKSASYKTLNECLRKLSGRKTTDDLLEDVKRHFEIDLVKLEGKGWKCTLLKSEEVPEITPLGTLVQQSIDEIDEIDQIDESTTQSERKNPQKTEKVVSEKPVDSSNPSNPSTQCSECGGPLDPKKQFEARKDGRKVVVCESCWQTKGPPSRRPKKEGSE